VSGRKDSVLLDERFFTGSAPQTFDLVSGDYYFALHRIEAKATPQTVQPAAATHRRVVASREPIPLQSLEPFADATRTLRLDRYSGIAVLDFKPDERVELDLSMDTSQWPADRRDSLEIILADMQGRDYSAEYVTKTPVGRLYHYILRGQAYRLTLVQQQGQWPRDALRDAEAAAPLTIRVAAIQPREIPSTLANLAQWLSDLKISDVFEVVESYDRRKDAASVPVKLRAHYDTIFKTVESVRKGRPGEPDVWKGEAEPPYVVSLRALRSRAEIRGIESKFWLHGGISLWDRVLRKISLANNIPGRQIVIDVPAYCSASLVFEVRPGMASRYGMECMMASHPVDFAKLSARFRCSAVFDLVRHNYADVQWLHGCHYRFHDQRSLYDG
jgi:hypothetical protein